MSHTVLINSPWEIWMTRWTLLNSQSWWGRTEILMPSSDHPNQGVAIFLGWNPQLVDLGHLHNSSWVYVIFLIYFFLSLFCSTNNTFFVLGDLDFYTHLFVRSGYYFLDIASSHWQWVRLIGTPEWLEMILLVKIGTSQHHGSCRVRFTLPKAPLSNYIPLHPITGWLSIIVVLTVTISVSFSLLTLFTPMLLIIV